MIGLSLSFMYTGNKSVWLPDLLDLFSQIGVPVFALINCFKQSHNTSLFLALFLQLCSSRVKNVVLRMFNSEYPSNVAQTREVG